MSSTNLYDLRELILAVLTDLVFDFCFFIALAAYIDIAGLKLIPPTYRGD